MRQQGKQKSGRGVQFFPLLQGQDLLLPRKKALLALPLVCARALQCTHTTMLAEYKPHADSTPRPRGSWTTAALFYAASCPLRCPKRHNARDTTVQQSVVPLLVWLR